MIKQKKEKKKFGAIRIIIATIAGLAAVALKVTAKGVFAYPDIIMVYTATMAFLYGERVGSIAGLVSGLLGFLLGEHGLCIQPAVYCLCGYFAPIAAREFFEWDGYEPVPVMLTSSGLILITAFGTLPGAILSVEQINLLELLTDIILPTVISTVTMGLIVGGICYAVLYAVEKNKDKKTKRNRK